jgi:ferric-dicitrate binding protein FerR (iron transport regulator)
MKISRALLIKFCQDQCAPDEVYAIQEWLNDSSWPDMEEGEAVPDDIRQKAWDKLHHHINVTSTNRIGIRRWNRSIAGIAAGLLVILGSLILFHYERAHFQNELSVYTTSATANRKLVLSDSSVVFLSPNSTIKAIQPFSKDKREIDIRGQAVFEVAKDASRPFTVIAGDIRTTALGTSFKVTSFPNNNETSVVLSSGKVVVKDYGIQGHIESYFLDPGEEIVYNKTARTVRKAETVGKQFDYKKNILYFRNAGIKEVVEKLERYYHVKVRYQTLNQVDWSVSGEFDYQPLKVVIKAIAYSCNISYKMNGDSLILIPDHPSKRDE